MAIVTTQISGNEEENAVLVESYCDDLSVVFRFELDNSKPFSISSRIVICMNDIEVDNENKTFPDRASARQAIYDSIARIWPVCASDPGIRLPDVIVQIQHDDHGAATGTISHENVFEEYLATLRPTAFATNGLIPESRLVESHYTPLESLQFSQKLGGRGGTTVTRYRDSIDDGGVYVYKGLSLRLFLEGKANYEFERDTFYRELKVIYSLPSHPNLLRTPSSLVTTGPCRSASHSDGQTDRLTCGFLYPFLERQSFQELISRSNESRTRLPLVTKAKWAYQIFSAMAMVHSSGQYHMDLKPSNMLLTNQDDVIVIDWEQCGASPFFLAPEANGLWDVRVAMNTETDEASVSRPVKAELIYQRFTGPLPDNCGTWPRRDVFQLWQRECPRALQAAEVYSAGRSLWVIFEQRDDLWLDDREQSDTAAVIWTCGSEGVPGAWREYVSRCMSLDPNERPLFAEAERFWREEWVRLEGNIE